MHIFFLVRMVVTPILTIKHRGRAYHFLREQFITKEEEVQLIPIIFEHLSKNIIHSLTVSYSDPYADYRYIVSVLN